MSLQKVTPVGFRFYKVIKQFAKTFTIINTHLPIRMNTKKYVQLNLYLGLSWAWGLWPAVKKDDNENKEDDSTSEILKQADELFEGGHYEECYILLDDTANTEKNVELQWRISRALYNMSKEKKYDAETRKLYVEQAFQVISELLEHNWDHFAVQKWYALLLDAKSSHEGVKERIRQLEIVKKHMDLAVSLNPSDATTLYMLGEWCFQITEMPWHQRKIAEVLFAKPPRSSYEDALDYFLRAEAAQPRFYSLNLLRLGKCYLKLQKEDQAKYYLKLAASYPAKSNEDHLANKEAAELLKKLQS